MKNCASHDVVVTRVPLLRACIFPKPFRLLSRMFASPPKKEKKKKSTAAAAAH